MTTQAWAACVVCRLLAAGRRAQEFPGPLPIVGGPRDARHQLPRRQAGELTRRSALTERLHRGVHGLHRRRDRLVPEQHDLDPVRGEPVVVGERVLATAEQQRKRGRLRDRFDLFLPGSARQEERVDAGGLVRLAAGDRVLQAGDPQRAGAAGDEARFGRPASAAFILPTPSSIGISVVFVAP